MALAEAIKVCVKVCSDPLSLSIKLRHATHPSLFVLETLIIPQIVQLVSKHGAIALQTNQI